MKYIILVLLLSSTPLYAIDWGGKQYHKEIKERDARIMDWDSLDVDNAKRIAREHKLGPNNDFVYVSYSNIIWVLTWGRVNLP